jgi:hypothetical protein
MVAEYTGRPRPQGAAVGDAGTGRRLQARLPSLIHDLIDCDLVERTAPGVWHLKGDVQTLLEHEVASRNDGDRLFIGLRCQGCGVRSVTALVEGRRLCSACRSRDEHQDALGSPKIRSDS